MRNSRTTLIRPEALAESVSTPVVAPLSPSVVYASSSPDELDDQYEGRAEGFTYAREGHPNAAALARRIDAMEGMTGGIVTGSGMSAVAAVLLGLCKTGDHVIGGDQLYGRSLRMMKEDLPRIGVTTTLATPTDAAAIRAAIRPETRLILVEAVSNPTLRVADLEGIAKVAKEAGVLLVVDNTFTTPRALRPVDLGADIVIHSVTKLLAGHSDVTLGWVAAKDPEVNTRLRVFAVTAGLTASPFDCWLAERGLATFPLRFDRAQETAARLADFLAETGARVLYPGRADHPEHDRARALLGGNYCNMVTFHIEGGRAAANAFVRAADGIAFAPTLGDVGTTLSHPATSSHRALPPEDRAKLGLSEGSFRVSVGLEEPEALLAVFGRALAAARG
ncbi:trans-sulfuration enzyme family protein [Mesobacterium pallidum]|uniref:trans-sulfuration enzyme family protein n=1 Tax=Mesobacterium pallidum TaxID=2872037 RepID=UPI001EE300EC|nr:aminotransferase class I/II-fold pyridoxal phosphate-dependent enzyme [Mesobacterium pallidum]